ncbi:hypothetical protein Peur_024788 [Populus x canadensis]
MLENEEKNENAEFRVKEVEYIQAEVKIIKCLVENVVVDISFNQLGGLFTLCFLEKVRSILDSRSDRSTSSKSFQKEIKKKEEEIKKKDDFIFEMKRQMDSMKEYLMNNLGYHGGTSNIDQGMLAPMSPSMPPPMAPQIMTSMGPTSPPIY